MIVRRTFKTALVSALYASGINRLGAYLTGARERPVVIAHHRAVTDFDPDTEDIAAALISVRTLEQEIEWLAKNTHLVSLDELGRLLKTGEKLDKRPAAITFDDGYRDVYDNVLPLVKRKGIPVAVFVVTDLVGTSELPLHDKLYLLIREALAAKKSGELLHRMLDSVGIRLLCGRDLNHDTNPLDIMRLLLSTLPQQHLLRIVEVLGQEFEIRESTRRKLQPLSWEMLEEMHREGVVIGSHTQSHALLSKESPSKVLEEAVGSRREIESRLGIEVQHFAYPDGRFNPSTVEAVATAGYRFGYTCCRHTSERNPLLTIPRLGLWENSCKSVFGRFSAPMMGSQVSGMLHFWNRCHHEHQEKVGKEIAP